MWIKGFIYYLYTIENNQTYPIVDLEFIKNKSIELEAENHQFQDFLRNLDSLSLDKAVFDLSEAISPKIECTDCGNCCKSLMVNINEEEDNNLSSHLGQTRAVFDEKYLDKGEFHVPDFNKRLFTNYMHYDRCPIIFNVMETLKIESGFKAEL